MVQKYVKYHLKKHVAHNNQLKIWHCFEDMYLYKNLWSSHRWCKDKEVKITIKVNWILYYLRNLKLRETELKL